MAIIEIDILHCDMEKRDATFRQVIDALGPPDGTVIVTYGDGEEFSNETVDEIVELLGDVGEIILVR